MYDMEMEGFHETPPINTSIPLPYGYTETSGSSGCINSIDVNGSSSRRMMRMMMMGSSSTSSGAHHYHENTGGGGMEIMMMDSRIWSRLPQRLVDRIIACLPPPALFRARAVCKRWYGLLYSNFFLQLYLQISPRPHHWFLFFNQQTLNNNNYYLYKTNTSASNYNVGYLLDPENLKWYRLSFPMIPPGFSPAASSGGLICWVSQEGGSKTILLSNPILTMTTTTSAANSVIQLPSTLRPRLCPSIGLTITPSSIDITVAGDDLISPYAVKNLTSESFHIDAGGFYSIWGTTSSVPRLCSLESGRMVEVQGRFYCMNYSPFGVLGYDVGSNQWCKIQAPMRRFLRSPSLVESRGRLILVAAVEKSKLNVPKSLRMWALQVQDQQQEEYSWVEIERMPQQLYTELAEMEGGRGFNCVGHGPFVVIAVKGTGDKAVLFDFTRKQWLWIPPCPYHNNASSTNKEDYELHGFGYEPKLAVPITAFLQQLTLPFQSYH